MQPSLQIQPEREFHLDDIHFRFLAELAHEKTGIVLPEQKRDMVYGRLVRRLRALKLDSFAEYCDLLQADKGGDEIMHMINAITTNLTRFFREMHHFEHLKETLAHHRDNRLRIWSAACSSGMEPYSIAMTLCEALPDIARRNVKILATDIDSNMLNTGMTGEYAASDLEDLPSGYDHYIEAGSKPDRVCMAEQLKKLIAFKSLNLLESWPMQGPFDAIFCRNVVIYFDKPTKEVLFDRMADMLKPGGWLYIGHSENLHGISNRFQLAGRTTYRRVV